MGPTVYSETSVNIYQSALGNLLQEMILLGYLDYLVVSAELQDSVFGQML
jgi:hypothetical protein